VWQFGSTSVANFTLEGHEKGVYDLTWVNLWMDSK
jgi:hypothetical protein